MRRVRDGRSEPRIPVLPLVLCLVLGVVMRLGSYLDLAEQTKSRRRWRHLCGLKGPLDHEVFGYVTERMSPEDWRQNQAQVANEHFASFSRTCPRCCQRQVEVLDSDGKKVKVTQYYHRYVFAHLSGPKFNLVLDLEPILPGEDECAAALRLLGRIRRLYGPRFFDGITADAWYAKGPFLRALDKLGWRWIVVLKREDMDGFQEAVQLSKNQKPSEEFRDERRGRQVQLWEVKDLHFSDGYTQTKSVQVVLSDERWTERRAGGGQHLAQPQPNPPRG